VDPQDAMQPQVFNSFWHGSSLSPLEWACLSSFIEHGHKFRLFSYEPIAVPSGVSLVDASGIANKEELFLVNGSVSAFSNLFRYKLCLKYGEWWVDTDVYCLKDDIPECSYAWASEDVDKINGAILKFPANDPLLFEISMAASAIGNKTNTWGELGPYLLTQYLAPRKFERHFGKREDFYPIHWLETFLFWLPHRDKYVWQRCKDSYFVHLWTSVFGQIGIDRYAKPPSGSFLDALYRRHLTKFSLKELDWARYNHTIELMKAHVNQEGLRRCSKEKIGYDVSEFPFDDYAFGRMRYWWETTRKRIGDSERG
jgi:Alpha 1,4-glycosyltransferase conserved region